MSLRTIGSVAAVFVIGVTYLATVSDALARAPAGTTRVGPHHKHHPKVHHSGQAGRHQPPATPPAGSAMQH
jgi:hypothetical protein